MSAASVVGVLVAGALLALRWPAGVPRHLRRGALGPSAGRVDRPSVRWRWRGRARDRGEGIDERVIALGEALAAALGSGLDVASAHAVVVGATLLPAALAETLDPSEGEEVSELWGRAGELSPVARSVGRALAVSRRLGAPAADAVRAAVRTGREALAAQTAVAGAVGGARATARLLTCLPLVGPLAVLALGLDPVATYCSPAAAVSCVAGLALTWLGHRWVRRQVARASRDEVIA